MSRARVQFDGDGLPKRDRPALVDIDGSALPKILDGLHKLAVGCKKHPAYRVRYKPRVTCGACHHLYRLAGFIHGQGYQI